VNILWQLLQTVPSTMLLWAAAQVLGLVLAIPVAAARMSRERTLRWIALLWIEVTRGIPTLVLLFIVYFGLSINDFRPPAMTAAILALGLSSSGYLAESIRAGFEAVPRQQTEAAMALSLPLATRLGRVLLPQALPIISEGVVSYAIHLFKETALASLIGVIEVMAVANYLVERGVNGPTVFLFTGAIYLVGCLLLAWLAHLIGDSGSRKRGKTQRGATIAAVKKVEVA